MMTTKDKFIRLSLTNKGIIPMSIIYDNTNIDISNEFSLFFISLKDKPYKKIICHDVINDEFIEVICSYKNQSIEIFVKNLGPICLKCKGTGESVCSECGNDGECQECCGECTLYTYNEVKNNEEILVKYIDLNQFEMEF